MTTSVLLAVLAVLVWPHREQDADGRGRRSAAASARRAGRVFQWPARRSRPADDEWVADLADVVAVGLDAGLDLGRAVLTAARSPTVARRVPGLADEVRRSVGAGQHVADLLGRLVPAETGGARAGPFPAGGPVRGAAGTELGVLVRAWRLSEHIGAAASTTTAAAAAALRARGADRERARTLVAGPRASMWLLTALPLAGPLVGLLVGVPPGRLYGSTAARLGAVVGLGLTVAGWAWSRRLLRRAGRPATTATRAR